MSESGMTFSTGVLSEKSASAFAMTSGNFQTVSIPRRIIQTARTSRLSLLGSACVSTVRLHNPEFEYRFFDDNQVLDFINTEFPEFRSVFDSFPFPIQRYDFFRYLAVYRLGGFYLDTDVVLAKSMDSLLGSKCVFPFEELTLSRWLRVNHQTDWEIGNYAFGAQAGHPFLKAVIENCVRAQKHPEWAAEAMLGIPRPFRRQFVVLYTTGPGLITRTLVEHPELQPDVTVLFPEDVCNVRTWHQFGDYGAHLMNASWRPKDGFFERRMVRFWETWYRRKVLKESQSSGPRRPGRWMSAHPALSSL